MKGIGAILQQKVIPEQLIPDIPTDINLLELAVVTLPEIPTSINGEFIEFVEIPTGINLEEIIEEVPLTNYIFDGGATSYLLDEAVTPTLLDGVVTQTWVIRMQIIDAGTQRGILGTGNCVNCLKWEADDDNQFDFALQDNGQSNGTQFSYTLDEQWYTYFWIYNGATMYLYEDTTLNKSLSLSDFIGRTAGRDLAVGAAVIGGSTPGFFHGKISDVQFYNKELDATERSNLVTDITDTTTGLVANFAGNKTETEWTDEVAGHVLTNQGGVTSE